MQHSDKLGLLRLAFYLPSLLPLLCACFAKQLIESYWRVQESWGLEPRKLIRDPERYILVTRCFALLFASILFAVAYWQDCQSSKIDQRIEEVQQLPEKLNSYFEKHPVVPERKSERRSQKIKD